MIHPESSTSPTRHTVRRQMHECPGLLMLSYIAVSLCISKSSCLEFHISSLCTLQIPIHLFRLNSSVGPSELSKWSIILFPFHLVPYSCSGTYYFAIFCGLVSFLLNVSSLRARNIFISLVLRTISVASFNIDFDYICKF